MVSAKEFLKPSAWKIVLSLTALIPSLILVFAVTPYFDYFETYTLVVIFLFGGALSYVVGCGLNHVKNKNVKIGVATILVLVSAYASYLVLVTLGRLAEDLAWVG